MYENLLTEVDKQKLIIDEKYDFKNTGFKGFYCDEVILLDKDISTTTERVCVLAEELGHYYTSVGNILNMKEVKNRKQEQVARTWAYNKIIGLAGIIRAFEYGCRNKYEIAEHLGVTEKFLSEALERYQQKYGHYTELDNYVIYFEPNLHVLKFIDTD